MVSRSLDYEKGLAELMNMFPQFDKELIELILENNSNIVETTIDSLIILSNESYGTNEKSQNKEGMISMFKNNKNDQKKIVQPITEKPKEVIKSTGYNDSRYSGSIGDNPLNNVKKINDNNQQMSTSKTSVTNQTSVMSTNEKPKTFLKTVKDGFNSKTKYYLFNKKYLVEIKKKTKTQKTMGTI